MKIVVEFYSVLREIAGTPRWELEMPPSTDLASVLEYLYARCKPELRQSMSNPAGTLAPGIGVLVNGKSAALEGGMKALLSDGDTVVCLVQIAGGADHGLSVI